MLHVQTDHHSLLAMRRPCSDSCTWFHARKCQTFHIQCIAATIDGWKLPLLLVWRLWDMMKSLRGVDIDSGVLGDNAVRWCAAPHTVESSGCASRAFLACFH